MLGRLLGGVATSLLFSVFEAWLIGAHSSANVMTHLPKSFSMAQYGNSIVAILAGQSKYCYCLI
jgi:MFS transporter, MFS domain-containing protein family, molybdate-anion transporter